MEQKQRDGCGIHSQERKGILTREDRRSGYSDPYDSQLIQDQKVDDTSGSTNNNETDDTPTIGCSENSLFQM